MDGSLSIASTDVRTGLHRVFCRTRSWVPVSGLVAVASVLLLLAGVVTAAAMRQRRAKSRLKNQGSSAMTWSAVAVGQTRGQQPPDQPQRPQHATAQQQYRPTRTSRRPSQGTSTLHQPAVHLAVVLVVMASTAGVASATPTVGIQLHSGERITQSTILREVDVLDVFWEGFSHQSNKQGFDTQPLFRVGVVYNSECPSTEWESGRFVDAGLATRATISTVHLKQATNNAANWICVLFYPDRSNMNVVQTLAVSSAISYDATPPNVDWASFTWDGPFSQPAILGVLDPESYFITYTYAFGTSSGGHQLTGTSDLTTVPVIPQGATAYVTVYATNAAGASSRLDSQGVLVDDSPAFLHTISVWCVLANGDAAVCQALPPHLAATGATVELHWQSGDLESGITNTRVCMEDASTAAECDVLAWSDLPHATATAWSTTAWNIGGANMPQKVRFRVEVTNGAKNITTSTSVELVVDGTAPSNPFNAHDVVKVNNGASFVSQPSFVVSWSGFSDGVEGSGIDHYEVEAHLLDVQSNTWVTPWRTTVFGTFTTVNLTNYLEANPRPQHSRTAMHVYVFAVDRAMLRAQPKVLPIEQVDLTPPTCIDNPCAPVVSLEQHGNWEAGQVNSTTCTFTVSWRMEDQNSGIQSVRVAVGTASSAFGEQLAASTTLSQAQMDSGDVAIPVDMPHQYLGVPLYVSHAVTNKAGLTTVTTVPHQMEWEADATPPVLELLSVGTGDTTRIDEHTRAWTVASANELQAEVRVHDAESGVVQVQLVVHKQDGVTVVGAHTEDVVASDKKAPSVVQLTAELSGVSLGNLLFVSAIAVNGKSLQREVQTKASVMRTHAAHSVKVPSWCGSTSGMVYATFTLPKEVMTKGRAHVSWQLSKVNAEPSEGHGVSRRSAQMRRVKELPTGEFEMEVWARAQVAHGSQYQAKVFVASDGGATLESVSNIMQVDTTPPVPPPSGTFFIRQTPSGPIDLELSWSAAFTDAESGMDSCLISIGTTPGGRQVYTNSLALGAVTHALSVIQGDAAMVVAGVTYYASVTCVNNVGIVSTLAFPHALLDVTPPTVLWVSQEDGNKGAASHAYLTSTQPLRVVWQAEDAETGIAGVAVCVTQVGVDGTPGSTCGAGDQELEPSQVTAGKAELGGVTLAEGLKALTKFTFTNGAGLTRDASVTATVDTQAPVTGEVEARPYHANLEARTGLSSNVWHLDVSWSLCAKHESCGAGQWSDEVSGIVSFAVGLGTRPYHADVMPMAPVGLAQHHRIMDLRLEENVDYWAVVTATDAAGLTSIQTAAQAVRVDRSPPDEPATPAQDGEVRGADASVQGSLDKLCMTWPVLSDPDSGVARVEVAFGLLPGGEQVVPYKAIELDLSAVCEPASLVNGVTYYGSVRATNTAGLVTVISTNGVFVDGTPPYAPPPHIVPAALLDVSNVHDPAPIDTAVADLVSPVKQRDDGAVRTLAGMAYDTPPYVASVAELALVWEPVHDLESAVTMVRCGLGFRRDRFDLFDNVLDDVSERVCVPPSNLLVVDGDPIFLVIEATNAAGVSARYSSPKPVIVDSTPPLPGATILMSSGLGSSRCLSAEEVQVRWDPFRDFDSGIVGYKLAIGTTPGSDDKVEWHDVGMHRNVVLRKAGATGAEVSLSVSLDAGIVSSQSFNATMRDTLYSSVKAVNAAGLESEALMSAASVVVCADDQSCVHHRHRCMDGSVTAQAVAERASRARVLQQAVQAVITRRLSRWLRVRFESEVEARGRRLGMQSGHGGRRLGADLKFVTFDNYWEGMLGADRVAKRATIIAALPEVPGGAEKWYNAPLLDCQQAMLQAAMVDGVAGGGGADAPPPIPVLQQHRACHRAVFYASRNHLGHPRVSLKVLKHDYDGKRLLDVPQVPAMHDNNVQYRGFKYTLDGLGRVTEASGEGALSPLLCGAAVCSMLNTRGWCGLPLQFNLELKSTVADGTTSISRQRSLHKHSASTPKIVCWTMRGISWR